MDVGAWLEDGGQGVLSWPEQLRGSLHTWQAVESAQRKSLGDT